MEPVVAWRTGLVRMTAFFRDSAEGLGGWKALTGEEPVVSNLDRRQNRAEERGNYRDMALTVITTKGRVDLIVSDPKSVEPAEDVTFDELVDFVKGLEVAREVVAKWLATSHPEILRLAFGASLLRPVAGHRQGYEHLDTLLPGLRLKAGAEDLSFQINRPRSSNVVTTLKNNRLSKWAVTVFHKGQLAVSRDGIVMQPGQDSRYACRLELDINTDATRQTPLPGSSLQGLWNELVDLGTEISEKGDVA